MGRAVQYNRIGPQRGAGSEVNAAQLGMGEPLF